MLNISLFCILDISRRTYCYTCTRIQNTGNMLSPLPVTHTKREIVSLNLFCPWDFSYIQGILLKLGAEVDLFIL